MVHRVLPCIRYTLYRVLKTFSVRHFGLSLGSGSRVWTQTKTQRDLDSEFDSIHFGIEIKKKEKK
jgi:hypothetical protein